jgi:origin recognition complex subunit 1
MGPPKRRSRAELARQALIGVPREDSDDEVVLEHPWEWIYEDNGSDDDDDEERAEEEHDGPVAAAASEQDRPRSKPSGKLRSSRQLARPSSGRGGAPDGRRIVGARMGDFQCLLGDTVLLKAADNESWVGLIHEFFEQDAVDGSEYDDDDNYGNGQRDKMARFLWFNSPHEIRNRNKRRTDALTVSAIPLE